VNALLETQARLTLGQTGGHFRNGSFAIDPADLAFWFMFGSLQKSR
jgi:hypothetical protein